MDHLYRRKRSPNTSVRFSKKLKSYQTSFVLKLRGKESVLMSLTRVEMTLTKMTMLLKSDAIRLKQSLALPQKAASQEYVRER
jgi:hypothetical protein